MAATAPNTKYKGEQNNVTEWDHRKGKRYDRGKSRPWEKRVVRKGKGRKEKEEAQKGEERLRQDYIKQYCEFCKENTEFLYDRCVICKNN